MRQSDLSESMLMDLKLLNKPGGTNLEDHVRKGKRFFMTLLYSLIMMLTGIVYSPLTAFSKTISENYDQPLNVINLTSSAWSFTSIGTGLIANVVMAKIGVRWSLVVSSFFVASGMCIRLLINQNFFFTHYGQIVGGLGSPYVSYGIATFASHWYNGSQTGIATTIVGVSGAVGTMSSLVLPFLFVTPNHKDTKVVKAQVYSLFLFHAILAVSLFVLVLLFFHENEAHAKVKAETQDEEKKEEVERKVPITHQLKYLFTDSRYVSLMIIYSLNVANINGIASTISPIVNIWGYEESFGATSVSLGLGFGVVFSIGYGCFILSKKGQLRNYQMLHLLSLSLMCGAIWSIINHKELFLRIGVTGFISLAMMAGPVVINQVSKILSTEYISLGTGLVYFFGQAGGALSVFFFGFALKGITRMKALFCLGYLMLMSGSMIFFGIVADCKIDPSKLKAEGGNRDTDTDILNQSMLSNAMEGNNSMATSVTDSSTSDMIDL